MVLVFKLFIAGPFAYNLLGMLLFVFLSALSGLIKNIVPIKMINFLSKYSYAAFLVHHQILKQILLHFKSSVHSRYTNLALFILTLLFIFFIAYVLYHLLEFIKNVLSITIKRISLLRHPLRGGADE